MGQKRAENDEEKGKARIYRVPGVGHLVLFKLWIRDAVYTSYYRFSQTLRQRIRGEVGQARSKLDFGVDVDRKYKHGTTRISW